MKQTWSIAKPDGTVKECTEKEFQEAIDRDLAYYNNGVLPTTDQERMEIAKRVAQRGKQNGQIS